MKRNKCLSCYKEISKSELIEGVEYHKKCSQAFFDRKTPLLIDFTQTQMSELAQKIISSQHTVTGVQPKLSLGRKKIAGDSFNERLTIVGLLGEYILKPQTNLYKQLPEIEDLTMHLAQDSQIITVPHSLIRLKSGELAYITKRVDRKNGQKIHMEDMCQLTERLTEYKYKGSYEQIGKIIKKYTLNPGLDLVNFYELIVFTFLTGNNDMHLKNFSLIKDQELNHLLCPAYDLVASELLVEDDDEELALNINGKKKKLKKKDFIQAMRTNGINEKAIDNIFKKFSTLQLKWQQRIKISFLEEDTKKAYMEMVENKFRQLEL